MSGFTGAGRTQKAAQEASGIPHSSEQPALPCPPWCTRNHNDGLGATSHSTNRYIDETACAPDRSRVVLFQTDYTDPILRHLSGQIRLHLSWGVDQNRNPVIRDLQDAEQFAEQAESFGRDDIAALIRELAALAKPGDLSGRGSLPSIYSSPDLSRG
jgi:hypothetical protein